MITNKHIDLWLKEWQKTSQRTEYPRAVGDALLKAKTSIWEIQDFVASAIGTKEDKRTPMQKRALDVHRIIKCGCRAACEEDASERIQGQIFLMQARDGMNPKQTINVESASIADVIAKNSVHRGE